MAAKASSHVEKAYERLMDISADEEKRMEYEAREKAIRDHNYLMDYNLKRGLAEGRKKGMELGIKEGLEQGLQQGLEQSTKAFIEMCQDDSYSREETASRLIHRLSLSPEAAEEYLKKYWRL